MLPKLHLVSRRMLTTISRRSGAPLRNRLCRRSANNNVFYSSPFFRAHRLFSVSTINVPNMGDSISEGTLVEWTKNIGDVCAVDDVVAVIETDKVSIDIRTDFAGVITEQLASIDDTLEVNAPLFKIDTSKTEGTSAPTPSPEPAAAAPSAPATPSPSSPAPSAPAAAAAAPIPPPPPPPSTSALIERSQERVAMSRMRQRIAQRLMEAQSSTASLTTFNEIDMKNIMAVRSKYKDAFAEKHGVKLGFMSAFVKASVSALEFMPAVNAYIDGKDLVYNNYCDVSVAVASPTGLVVPVIRNAQTLSFSQVEAEILGYAAKAKSGKLSLEEMTGGTFTISNGGVFGSLFGTPIINPPQSAILGMHGTFEKAVAVNGKVEVRPIMAVALTYDHRIVDGREAVLFLKRIKECIEDPVRLLLDV